MISFRNEGLIDLDAIRTFGVSSKVGENPIGFFGTGLKYAIAIILRHGGEVVLYRGKRKFVFGTRRKKVRRDTFDVVTMNDEALGFTTHMGASWEAWQAFRELYCNALDEAGQATASRLPPKAGHTTIHVTRWPAFEQAFAERDEIVLTGEPWRQLPGGVEVYRRPSQHIYYRGIRAANLEHPSRFTYNLTREQELTEDRTLKHGYIAAAQVRDAVVRCDDEGFLREWLRTPDDHFEHGLDLDCFHAPTEALLDVIQELQRDINQPLNRTAARVLRTHRETADQYTEAHLTDQESRELERALQVAEAIGLPAAKYRLRVVDSLGPGVLGRALEGQVLLSRRAFTMGGRCVLGTLLEEVIHLEHALPDESRAMQNYLIDLMAQLAERVTESEESAP